MEQEKNSKGVITLLVVIIVILLALVILLATGKISFKTDEANITNNNLNNESSNNGNDDVTYKLGDVVKLSKIQNDNENSNDDYTEWYVLAEEGGYTKLYSKNIWGGKGNLNDIGLTTVNVYNRLHEYGYNVTKVRQLNEEELDLFSCNIDYKKLSNTIKSHDSNPLTNVEYSYIKLQNSEINCTNLPAFVYENTTTPYTDVQLFGYTLSIGEQMSLHIHDSNALVGFLHPVIILPTSEIG